MMIVLGELCGTLRIWRFEDLGKVAVSLVRVLQHYITLHTLKHIVFTNAQIL